RDAWDEHNVECAPSLGTDSDLFADCRGHREHAGIAAGYDRDAFALRGVAQRIGGPCCFLAVVGRMAALAGPPREAVEIRTLAIERFRVGERRGGLGSEIAFIAGSQADDGEPSAHRSPPNSVPGSAPGRWFQPGTRTTAK